MFISRLLHKQFLIKEDDLIWVRMIVCSRIFGIIMYGHKTDALVRITNMLSHIWSVGVLAKLIIK